MASNAWERAQDAIAHASRRATERDETVITPDTAVSPFDASSTTVLPHAVAARGGGALDPDLTQRLPHTDGRPATNGHRSDSDPVSADDDASTVRFETRLPAPHPGTAPFPAAEVPAHDETPAQDPPRRSWWRRLFGRR